MGGLRAHLFALLAVAAFGAVWAMDEIASAAHETHATDATNATSTELLPGHREERKPRAFLLLIDSLRYSMAMDTSVMPELGALRERSACAQVDSSRDSVTVSAIRAAFTGRDGASATSFVWNFWRGDANIDSVFKQLAATGRTTAAWSDGSFAQFGSAVEQRAVGSNVWGHHERAEQLATARGALEEYKTGEHALVIVHLTFTDHVAHAEGIGTELYFQAFRSADGLVGALAREIPPEDTLIVMGDHGHDDRGRHFFGTEVPTFLAYRGAAFRAGVDLGNVSITEHRYLLSKAMGLPAAADRSGGGPGAHWGIEANSGFVSGPTRIKAGILALHLGALAWLWFAVLTGTLEEQRRRRLACAWICALALPLSAFAPWNTVVGLGALGASIAGARRTTSAPYRALGPLAVCAAALLMFAWGGVLQHFRQAIHEPPFVAIAAFWIVLGACGIALTRKRGATVAAWVCLALPALLFFPSVYRYGAVASMGPAWISCLVFLFVENEVQGSAERSWLTRRVALYVAAALIVLPFYFVDAQSFRFLAFGGPLTPQSPRQWLLFGALAKGILFFRRKMGRLEVAAAIAMTCVLLSLDAARWHLSPRQGVLFPSALLGLAFGLRQATQHAGLRRIALVGGLALAYRYLIKLPIESYSQGDALLAAFVVSGVLARKTLPPETRARVYPLLLVLGALAAGWMSFAWTIHRIEWRFLYDWIEPEAVERRVWLLFPVIIVRYALPAVLVRILLAEQLHDVPYPHRSVLLAAGIKAFALACTCLGIGFAGITSAVYLDAVQESLIGCALVLGVL